MENYDDIIHLPHHVSATRPQMPRKARAAQFAPFAALTGYEDLIAEAARQTEAPVELGEDEIAAINRQLLELRAHLEQRPPVTVCYFQPDARKLGGRYVTEQGRLAKIDPLAQVIALEEGPDIPMQHILRIQPEEDG